MTDKVREALEAVARVICENSGIQPDGQRGGTGPDWRDPSWTGFLGAAEKAIRAYLAASAPPAPDGLVGRMHYAIEEAEFGHESPTHVRALVTHLKQAVATLSAQEAEIERLRKEQQAKDAVYWATAEQCANLETDLTQLRKERDEAQRLSDWYHETHNATISSIWVIIGRDTGQNLNKRLSDLVARTESAEAEVARLRKVVEGADPTTEQVERALVAWHDVLSIKDSPRSEFWRMYAALRAARQFAEEVK